MYTRYWYEVMLMIILIILVNTKKYSSLGCELGDALGKHFKNFHPGKRKVYHLSYNLEKNFKLKY